MERLALHIESLIFSAESTIGLNQIKTCIEETLEQSYKNVEIKKAIDSLIEKYRSDEFSFEIAEIASGYKFLTKGSFHNTVGTLIKKNNQKRLSKAALETLSIIAYKQNVTKSDVEGIRGVNCDYTIQKLLEKDLVTIKGRADGPGRPLLYGTSDKFMDYFGIKDIDSLPKLQDLKVPEIQIGEPAPIEEDRAASTNEANIDTPTDDENDDGNQADSVSEANIEGRVSDDGNQADSITEANIDEQENDIETQAEPVAEANNEEQVSDDGNQAESITEANIDEQENDIESQAASVEEATVEEQLSDEGNQADSITEEIDEQVTDDDGIKTNSITQANNDEQESEIGDQAAPGTESKFELEENQETTSTIDTVSPKLINEEETEVINGEKPMEDEEAHQALLNHEIVSSVNTEETTEEIVESVKTSIISDEEE